MKQIVVAVTLPDLSGPDVRDEEGQLTRAARAKFGQAATNVGTPDRGANGPGPEGDRTDALDTVTNILLWLHSLGIEPQGVLDSAVRHFRVEVSPETVESRAVGILKAAGIDACLQHTGGGVWVAEARSSTIPGRAVWVTDSEGDAGGAFLVGAYPDSEGEDWIEALSGSCFAEDLPARVDRGLTRLAD